MSLGWLFPLGLSALAALLLPLLLHLARRREQRLLRFAAMRWLPAGRAPRRKFRLQERRLLLLRLLLVALAALWLAQPILRDAGAPLHWLAIAPGVDPDAARRIAQDYERVVWLHPGLPPLQPRAPNTHGQHASAAMPGDHSVWLGALQEFSARLPADDLATALVPATVGGMGERLPALAHRIAWLEAPAAPASDAMPPPRRLALRDAGADAGTLHRLRAAIAAWEADPQLRVQLDDAPASTPVPATAHAVLWVGDAPRSDAVSWAGDALRTDAALPRARLLHVAADVSAAEPPSTQPATTFAAPMTPLPVRALDGAPGDWQTLSVPLTPAALPALHDPAFPRRLHATLFGPPTPGLVPASRLQSLLVLPTEPSNDVALAPRGMRDRDLSAPLGWLLLALLVLERIVATGGRLARGP